MFGRVGCGSVARPVAGIDQSAAAVGVARGKRERRRAYSTIAWACVSGGFDIPDGSDLISASVDYRRKLVGNGDFFVRRASDDFDRN